jgi:membrane-associated phospholipid phosphatase
VGAQKDFSYQGFLNAALILLSHGAGALDPNNPYNGYGRQGAFVNFGGPDILTMVAQVALMGLKAAWYQKWSVHRRARPEAIGCKVHSVLSGTASYPIHPSLLASPALEEVQRRHRSALLPMAFPEGCPAHPAYPAGHAAIAGACTTVLKAFFNEAFVIPNAKVADDAGVALTDHMGPELTAGGELDKLAANVSIGRNIAGVHYYSDGIEGMNLGEAVAIAYLQDVKSTYPERSGGFTLKRFSGATVRI